MNPDNNLGINVDDNVRMKDKFGNIDRQMKGIGGTLHLVNKGDSNTIIETAWNLSQSVEKPVIIVVRAPKKI